ncbi:MAG: phenylalanine--tRNA ligase subunit beta [Anaerolineales bacterium]|nr:phenylalanine--tRNA ligase subunit beta [Anaerolineales bacterium]
MKVPISWLQDYVDVDVSLNELARRLTLAGLEVEEIRYVGLPLPAGEGSESETAVTGLGWDREKIVVGEVREVMPHPDADRLVLCRVFDGDQEHTVVTGAPNLFPYLEDGPLDEPLKVAYALEGARLYDGHEPGWQEMTLEPATIRGVESYSMVCSEKELGISEYHEGVILLDDDAEPGTPLVEYMGDAVLDIAITPNIARDANVLGIARETAAVLGVELREPDYEVEWEGPSIEGRAAIEIRAPELNPRFVLGLIEDVEIEPSPYWVQRRLQLAGVRPINNIVDTTNYVMLEIGEPLHAFDYDILVDRADGESPTIITRTAEPGETLRTLDDVDRELDDFTVLVTDEAGPLSIAGVMGGEESEVHEGTRNVLLEGAAWNFINIRRTLASQRVSSEAAYRFERGVHPALAERGVRRGLQMMSRWADGTISEGLIDEYPLQPERPEIAFSPADVQRWLGVELPPAEIAELLDRLEFDVEVEGQELRVRPPDHRLDIGSGVVGVADVMEEIARVYGYDRIPVRLLEEEIPAQPEDETLQLEERVRDLLVDLGLQEVVTYRLTTPEREARLRAPGVPEDDRPYVRLENPSSSEREVMRHSLLASVLEIVERNARVRGRIALFEVGPVYIPRPDQELPEEPTRLALALHGRRGEPTWIDAEPGDMGFFDVKGIVERLFDALRVEGIGFEPGEHPALHPGKCAQVTLEAETVGFIGELHPLVAERYKFREAPVVVGTFDLERVLEAVPGRFSLEAVPEYPPVLEDLAVVVDESTAAAEVEGVIYEAGGELLEDVRLFDYYRGEQIGESKKSLAYSLVYQAPDRTLTDDEVAEVRTRIIEALGEKLGAELRA